MLQPLPGQELPGFEQLRAEQLHSRQRERGLSPAYGFVVVGRLVVVGVIVFVEDGRERLGESLGQVTEDVRWVVELDDVVGRGEALPVAL